MLLDELIHKKVEQDEKKRQDCLAVDNREEFLVNIGKEI